MDTKAIQYFLDSTGALFFAVAMALLIGIHASIGVELPHDSLLQIPLRTMYWTFAGLALSMALVCLFSHKTSFKAALILWMTLNVVVYVVGAQWNGSKGDLSAYLSCVADAFGLTPGAAFWLAKISCFYLVIGSGTVLLLGGKIKAREEKMLAQSLKMACPECGGRIRFAIDNLGQKIPCPHCEKTVTLRKPENLKMSCFFCQEHIEFPAHALGEKMPCPHCSMDITLNERG